jgi:TolA-binding protein
VVRLFPLALVLAAALPMPVAAQAVDVGKLDRRVGKLESEMRAVQRKVFPGGDARFFEPEIPPPSAAPAPAPTAPATTPITDLTARVDALEGSVRTLTGQIEAVEYKLRQLEDGQRRMKGDVEFRLNTLENPGGAAAATPGDVVAPAAGTPTPPPASAVPAAELAPAKPATADTAWALAYPKVTAREWPAVESQMTKFVADWPKSPRVAQAKYWIGRSHAARNQHAQAAQSFLDVYQSAPRSTPAPDALIGLAGALNAMAKTENACQVLGELQSVYGAKLTDTQKADAARQRTRAKCAA